MEQISVYRGNSQATDFDGNSIQSQPKFWKSFQALVAPTTVENAVSSDAISVTYDYTVYIKTLLPTGIRETDIIGVRGHKTYVVGPVAVWENQSGKHIGDVLTVKRKEA